MLIFNTKTQQKLWRIVRQISGDSAAQEDLMQEALVHLWQQEVQRPAQTLSWYLQSCRFHLLNYLNRGRSVDSFKHRNDRCSSSDEVEFAQSLSTRRSDGESPLDSVCAVDIIELLSQRLTSKEQDIFAHLVQGLGPREIAKKLRISHQSVSKYRQKLAALAMKMGISPLPQLRQGSAPARNHAER